jgi:flagellar basal-body M-ring protein/flagellar hook-basal body protein (fliF)
MDSLKPFAARLRRGGARLLRPELLRSLAPLVFLAVCITALVMLYMWRDQASYKPVFGAREDVDSAAMMSVLDGAGIAYRIHPESGQVLVPEERLGEVRMLLASRGVVAKLPAGLELMDRNDPFGVSQFVQDVRFRRGLEGELARSIMTLDAVESARVHLSLERSTSFVIDDGNKSSASVVLRLRPGRELEPEHIAAIVKLVSGSVASLDPSRVTLVDQAGRLLSARIDTTDGVEASHVSDLARRYQEETRRNVHDLLTPVVGVGNFRVSVTAEVDNDRIRETREQYGDTPRLTSEATRAEIDRDPLALGVPGSLSNRPIAIAKTTESSEAEDGTGTEITGTQRNATTRQYAYDRTITQIERSRGKLHRLGVAVVLNDKAAPGGGGTWTAEQLADIERILRSGLGIDTERGDSLVVSSLPFPEAPTPVVPIWWKQPENLLVVGRWVFYALAALLIYWLIVRPLLRLAQKRVEVSGELLRAHEPALAAPGTQSLPGNSPRVASVAAPQGAAPVGQLLEDYDLPPPGSPVDVMVDHLKALAAKEPERVAEVVRQWVQK